MIWCEMFGCATIGRYITNKIVCDANSICFMMWQESPTMSHMRKSRPHGFYHDWTSTTRWHQVRLLQVQGPPPMAPETPGKRLQKDQKSCESFHMFIALWPLIGLARWPGKRRFPDCTRLGRNWWWEPGFEFSSFWEDTYGPRRGPLEKEGIGVKLLLKGVTKTHSFMRNVLGNLMTPAILFVALEWRKYDSNIC